MPAATKDLTATIHGHGPRPHYMLATFVAVGQGSNADTKLEFIRNVDVARRSLIYVACKSKPMVIS